MKELVFTPHGTAQLLDGEEILWASDDDPDFAEEFGDEFLEDSDTDDICDYLVEIGELDEGEEIEVIEEDLEDFAGGEDT